MEVNKEEAARCRDIGAAALRKGQHARAVKFFNKSLHLYPLPGVKALLGQAERKLAAEEEGGSSGTANGGASNGTGNFNRNSTSSSNGFAARSSSSASASASASAGNSTTTGADGREYTEAQVKIVEKVLKARKGGRGAHYRVLELETNADDSAIKKAYRKLALKLHPDKNSAPHADEAFKAVGLAYATLSDTQKRRIYDTSGEEDPDNRGGGMRPGNMNFNGQEVSPEDIFNMFFGGGMPGGAGGMGGPGVRVYSTGFGPGMAFGGPGMAFGGMPRARRQQPQQQPQGPLQQLAQFLPVIMIMLLSFMNMGSDAPGATGGSRYFSLTPVSPHTNPLHTRLAKVKDIPYYVSDQFLRTVARDRYQLSQVERMVERSYQMYLREECNNQKAYKKRLEYSSRSRTLSEADREKLRKKTEEFSLGRCLELEDLFPGSVPERERVGPRSEF